MKNYDRFIGYLVDNQHPERRAGENGGLVVQVINDRLRGSLPAGSKIYEFVSLDLVLPSGIEKNTGNVDLVVVPPSPESMPILVGCMIAKKHGPDCEHEARAYLIGKLTRARDFFQTSFGVTTDKLCLAYRTEGSSQYSHREFAPLPFALPKHHPGRRRRRTSSIPR